MYKLKDWPMDASFAEKLARHNDDFLAMLNRWARAAGWAGDCRHVGGGGQHAASRW